MFNFIKNTFDKLISHMSSRFQSFFARTHVDEEAYTELQKILIEADVGFQTTRLLLEKVRAAHPQDGAAIKRVLQAELLNILHAEKNKNSASVILMVGINGSGKTTCVSKLAYRAQQEGKKVLLVAADTFRSAAQEQLVAWATKLGCDIVTSKSQQDPASVVFEGCQKFRSDQYDVLIIDTAGRLQTKVNLMQELAKIKRIITKILPDKKMETLLTVDSMLGQNSLDQARLFHESTNLDGLILTKLDGTGKGGIIIAIAQELGIAVRYVSYGEQPEQLDAFDAIAYLQQILG